MPPRSRGARPGRGTSAVGSHSGPTFAQSGSCHSSTVTEAIRAPPRAGRLDVAQRPLGLRHRLRRRDRTSAPDCVELGRSRCRSRRRRRRAASARRGLFRACWYRRDVRRRRRSATASGCCCTSAPWTTRATVWVERRARRRGTRAATRRSPSTSPPSLASTAGAARSSCAPRTTRTISPSRAASRTGSSSPHSIWYPRTTGIWQTVWLERVPATLDRRAALDAEPRALGDRLRARGSTARDADPAPARAAARAATSCSPTTRYRSIGGEVAPPDRAVRPGHRRLPQRAALEPGAADADRRRADAVDERRRRARSRSSSYTALRVGRGRGRPLHAQRPAVPAAAGARPGLLAGHAA